MWQLTLSIVEGVRLTDVGGKVVEKLLA